MLGTSLMKTQLRKKYTRKEVEKKKNEQRFQHTAVTNSWLVSFKHYTSPKYHTKAASTQQQATRFKMRIS